MKPLALSALILSLTGCTTTHQPLPPAITFADDLAFLKSHTDVITLQNGDARVAIVPAWQGRVMTSTSAGDAGPSFGWINRQLIASRKLQPHINVFGGEDRFWLGPEGGPFSIFFEKGKEQTLANWQTPAAIDTEPFETVSVVSDQAIFRRVMKLKNASDTIFDVEVTRTIKLLDPDTTAAALGIEKDADIKLVAYESNNRIANAGQQAWRKETGLLSVWILGMFNPSDATTILIPIQPGQQAAVNDAYFGKVPAERLKVTSDKVFFSGDGRHRSKIGIAPAGANSTLGSYDAANHVGSPGTELEFAL